MLKEQQDKLNALKITMDYNKRTDDSLNNILFELKTKYNIEDNDWLRISVAFSMLTAKKMAKVR